MSLVKLNIKEEIILLELEDKLSRVDETETFVLIQDDSVKQEFENEFLAAFPKYVELKFDSTSQKYLDQEVQFAWWAWQVKNNALEIAMEKQLSYECECVFLDDAADLDLDENLDQQIEEQVEERFKAKMSLILDRANRFGLIEMCDELERLAFSIGQQFDKQKLYQSSSNFKSD
jgi:hypothetical protein